MNEDLLRAVKDVGTRRASAMPPINDTAIDIPGISNTNRASKLMDEIKELKVLVHEAEK